MNDQPAPSTPDLRDEMMTIYKAARDRLEISNVALTARIRTLEAEKQELADRLAAMTAEAAGNRKGKTK
ncbi:MAG: hypothetical protein ABJG86_09680 [Nitratireductor sp.]